MQAVLLAAGMGRRLGSLTQDQTKCMLRLHGTTLIERSLDALVAAEVDRIVLVVGYRAEGVRELIGNNYSGVPVVYVTNHDYDTTNNIHSLYLARDEFAKDDTLLLESDLVYDPEIITNLVAHPQADVAVVAHHESWMDGTVVTLTPDAAIEQFVPKAMIEGDRMHTYYKTVNIYKFSQQFITERYLPFLEAYVRAVGSNEYYEQVLGVIAGLGRQGLVGMPLDGERWYEIDDMQDYQIAETLFSPEESRYESYLARHGGYWRFPGLRDFCYLVNPYFPPVPMIDEIQRSFGTLLSEYPSSLVVQNNLAAKLFDCRPDSIIVGNGAAELITGLGAELDLGKVGVSIPTFEEYLKRFPDSEIITRSGGERAFRADVKVLEGLLRETDALVVVNPDNPSGQCLSTQDVRHLASVAEVLGKRLILDESFVDFADPDHCTSFLNQESLEQYPNMVVIKSISKSYGVPGARLGVLASRNEELMTAMRRRASVWNINSFGEYFLQIVGKYQRDYVEACRLIRAERSRFTTSIDALEGVRVLPSQANFLLCEITASVSSRELADRLLIDHAILIKDCGDKPGFGPGAFIRIAVRDEADNTALVVALGSILETTRPNG